MKKAKPVFLPAAAGLLLAAACNNTPSADKGGSPEVEVKNPPSVSAPDPQAPQLRGSDVNAPHLTSKDFKAPQANGPSIGGSIGNQRTDAGTQ